MKWSEREGYYQNMVTGTVMWPAGYKTATKLPAYRELDYYSDYQLYTFEFSLETPAFPRFVHRVMTSPPTSEQWKQKMSCEEMRAMQWAVHRRQDTHDQAPQPAGLACN